MSSKVYAVVPSEAEANPNTSSSEVVTVPEDGITVELGEHLQFEEDHFIANGKLCYYPGMRSPNRVTGKDMSQPRTPRRHAGPDTSTHAALNNTALSLNILPPVSGGTSVRPSSTASQNTSQLAPLMNSPRRLPTTQTATPARNDVIMAPIPSPPASTQRNRELVVASPHIKQLAAQQEVDTDPFSIRKQLQAIHPLPAVSRILHNLPLVDAEYKSRLGLKLLQRVACEKDPAVQWRRLTPLELQDLKRREAEAEEEAARKLRIRALMEEQKPKLSEHEEFMRRYDQSRREARMQEQGEEDRIKDLTRRLANTDKQLAKEKLMRDREPTTQIVHKIFDEGRQIKAAASPSPQSSPRKETGQKTAVVLTKLPPLNDADVQARKAKYHADMQLRIAKMKEEATALATAEEESRAGMEEAAKARRLLEEEKAAVLANKEY